MVRTAQYGCNCRDSGGNGGCGEFDILEAIIGNQYSDMLFTTVYDFKGAASPGTAKYFERPSVSLSLVLLGPTAEFCIATNVLLWIGYTVLVGSMLCIESVCGPLGLQRRSGMIIIYKNTYTAAMSRAALDSYCVIKKTVLKKVNLTACEQMKQAQFLRCCCGAV